MARQKHDPLEVARKITSTIKDLRPKNPSKEQEAELAFGDALEDLAEGYLRLRQENLQLKEKFNVQGD